MSIVLIVVGSFALASSLIGLALWPLIKERDFWIEWGKGRHRGE